jgi:hypothetical protein
MQGFSPEGPGGQQSRSTENPINRKFHILLNVGKFNSKWFGYA